MIGMRFIAAFSLSLVTGPLAAATFTVTSTADSGSGTLREAIGDANASAGLDTIEFSPSGSAPWQIFLDSPLPTITEAVEIDATTVPGYSGDPLVQLSGTSISNAPGLHLATSNSTVRGLSLINFPGPAIYIEGGAEHFIEENWIGITPAGESAGNDAGILVTDANSVFIGSGGRNVIARNAGPGIELEGGIGAEQNVGQHVIENNYLGIRPDGSAFGSSSGGSGVLIRGSAENVIGSEGNGNVISGYGMDQSQSSPTAGIRIIGEGATDNSIVGNMIGVDPSGSQAIGNGVGVLIGLGGLDYQSDNLIGVDGTDPATRNVISGNALAGIVLRGLVGENVIQGNHIGVGADGTTAIPNGYGILFQELGSPPLWWPQDTTIGGPFEADRNVISGNRHSGVVAEYVSDASIVGNHIGVSADGQAAVGNGHNGVWLRAGGDNFIGEPGPGLGNHISGNAGAGVVIDAARTRVYGNRIGPDASGGGGMGNAAQGVKITGGAFDSIVGGSFSGESNRIAHNGRDGVLVTGGSATSGNAIDVNAIHENGDLGIDLAGGQESGNGRTANDDGDGDDGPNRLQNWPDIRSADYDAGTGEWQVEYRVDSDPGASGSGASAFPLEVNFFLSDADGEEGREFVGSDTFTASDANAPGYKQLTVGPSPVPSGNQGLMATATDSDGNTSEFTGKQVFATAFELDPEADVDRNGDTLEVPSEPDVSIIGSTNLPAGSGLRVEVATSPGNEPVFIREHTVDVQSGAEDNTWTVIEDFSDLPDGHEMRIVLRTTESDEVITPDGEPVPVEIVGF